MTSTCLVLIMITVSANMYCNYDLNPTHLALTMRMSTCMVTMIKSYTLSANNDVINLFHKIKNEKFLHV